MASFESEGMPASMMLLGVATYGRSCTLSTVQASGVGTTSSTPGSAGETTLAAGILSYTEVIAQYILKI